MTVFSTALRFYRAFRQSRPLHLRNGLADEERG